MGTESEYLAKKRVYLAQRHRSEVEKLHLTPCKDLVCFHQRDAVLRSAIPMKLSMDFLTLLSVGFS